MEKILFFGTMEMAKFWYKHTLRYLAEKGYDSKKANPNHLELEIGDIRLVYCSVNNDFALYGRRYSDVYHFCERRFEDDFEKAFLEILGGKAND